MPEIKGFIVCRSAVVCCDWLVIVVLLVQVLSGLHLLWGGGGALASF